MGSYVRKEPEFYHGLRVTDKETMEVAEMVLFKVNQELVAMMAEVGVKAVGLSGKRCRNDPCEEKRNAWKRSWICR